MKRIMLMLSYKKKKYQRLKIIKIYYFPMVFSFPMNRIIEACEYLGKLTYDFRIRLFIKSEIVKFLKGGLFLKVEITRARGM